MYSRFVRSALLASGLTMLAGLAHAITPLVTVNASIPRFGAVPGLDQQLLYAYGTLPGVASSLTYSDVANTISVTATAEGFWIEDIIQPGYNSAGFTLDLTLMGGARITSLVAALNFTDGIPSTYENLLNVSYSNPSPTSSALSVIYTTWAGSPTVVNLTDYKAFISLATPVPEPASMAMLAIGLAGVIGATRRR